ncbi:hypothetical protein LJC57_07740 [Parabacteroides sp. OttesenSCG-928-G07]|nr:hypothetical protein [Parabacteroides sp. OttesenSCG-928-G07]
MKLLKLFSVMAMLAVVLFTSCVGDNETVELYTDLPFVSDTYNGKVVVMTPVGRFYSNVLQAEIPYSNTRGLITCQIAAADNKDVEAQGYYNVSVFDISVINDEGYVGYFSQTDTSQLSTSFGEEIALKQGVSSYEFDRLSYINNYLFITTSFTGMTNQKNYWQLYYNTEASGKKEGKNVYSVFLRVNILDKGTTPNSDFNVIIPYDISNFAQIIEDQEKTAKNESYYLKVHYINQINDDGTFSWATAPYEIEFGVSEK